jgi:hypothetical protein
MFERFTHGPEARVTVELQNEPKPTIRDERLGVQHDVIRRLMIRACRARK